MKKSESIKELAAALAKAQAEMKPAIFDCVNPHFKSKYASLTAVWEAARGPLAKHGLSVLQRFESGEPMVMSTLLAHASGEWIESDYPIKPVKTDPQGYGSAISYARRYSLAALLGIVSDSDDDANAASGKPAQTREVAPQAAQFREPSPPLQPQPKAAPKPAEPVDSSSFVPSTGYLKGKALRERSEIELEGYILDVTEKLVAAGKTVDEMSPQGRLVLDMVSAEVAKRQAQTPKEPGLEQGSFDSFGGSHG